MPKLNRTAKRIAAVLRQTVNAWIAYSAAKVIAYVAILAAAKQGTAPIAKPAASPESALHAVMQIRRMQYASTVSVAVAPIVMELPVIAVIANAFYADVQRKTCV